MKCLALMGIRSGSKGLSHKNIRELNGFPLFTWALSAARRSNFVNRIVVSTDSSHYMNLLRSYDIEVPYLRPTALSSDNSPELEYISHMLKFLKETQHYIPDIVVRLLATVPMQLESDIDLSVSALLSNRSFLSSVVVAPSRQHPMKALRIEDHPNGEILLPYSSDRASDITPISRSLYNPSYHRANIITFYPDNIKYHSTLTPDNCYPIVIDETRSVDIDTLADFFSIEGLMQGLDWNNQHPNYWQS